MKRSHFLFGVTAFILIIAAAGPALAQTTYQLDPVHSQVVFKVKHFGVSNNYGRFNKVEGMVKWDAALLQNSAIEITIATESVDTGAEKRDQHLRSNDFFNAKQFPVITFKSKSISSKGGNMYSVTGDLMLHGVTKEITADFEFIGEIETRRGRRIGGEAMFTIKRSEFGMNFMIDNGTVGDDVTVMVNVEASGS